jgi:flagellar biosynthesis chaperone FliJ
MTTENNIWKTLAGKETAKLVKLSESKEALFSQKKRLIARIADIDQYIFEYTSRLQEESDFEYGVQKINGIMAMVTQLISAKRDLEVFDRECSEALTAVTSKIVGHQVELLKFNKVSERHQKQIISSENMKDDKELDAIALHNFSTVIK